MPSKSKTIYSCTNCGAQFPKWSGRCLECGTWGALTEEIKRNDKRTATEAPAAEILNLSKVNAQTANRYDTGIDEMDRVLGGGLVPGSLVLLAGEPGIGKSTILAQLIGAVNNKHKIKCFYASGEESASQIKSRFERLKLPVKDIDFISETNVDMLAAALKKEPDSLVVVDSVQTVHVGSIPSEAGSVNQIRASTMSFLELAKENNIALVLVGHITKDGQVAGPKTLEHMVDTVLYLESGKNDDYRSLRAQKNRFGSVNELGMFEMGDSGFRQIKNPAAIFLDAIDENPGGSVISVIMKGTRPFMVEIQALVTKTIFGYPQRKASGYDLNRLQVLCAVLTKKGGINLTNQDVVINIVGGMKLSDPALDLAVCMAIASSLLNQKVSRKTVILGEVGLGGEVRNISKLNERIKEAKKLGFDLAYIPASAKPKTTLKTQKIKLVSDIVKEI